MNDLELINLWKGYDKKLEENLSLNKKNATEITKLKVQSILATMKPIKIFTLVVGILWVGFIDILIINLFFIANPIFIISAAIQVVLTKVAIGIYVYQLILLQQVNINAPVLETQERLAQLKSSTLWVSRLLFLQLPVWTTFYWNSGMLENGNIVLWTLQFMVTVSFLAVSIWLFLNINYKNKDKKWFQLIFNGSEWTPIMQSLELLEQIEDYKA